MKIILIRFIIIVVALLKIGFVSGQSKKIQPTEQYVATLKSITDIMVNDVTSPVAAARYYGYITLAA